MKSVFLFLFAATFTLSSSAQTITKPSSTPDPSKPILTVTAACGKCMFGMTANDCTLAVRIKGKTYFVDGANIDDYGDAHAKKGFCNATCKAEVQGEVVGNRFHVTYFKPVKTN